MEFAMKRITACLTGLAIFHVGAVCAQTAQRSLPPQPPAMVEGQPIEKRPPEKADDKPLFPNQTRAPFHASAPFNVTTLLDNLHVVWGMAFLPDGRMLLNERLPGAMHILDRNGKLSAPLEGVTSVAADKDIVLLDVAVDPKFTQNHRIFFTFCDYFVPAPGAKMTDSNTFVASARLDGDAVTGAQVIFRAVPNHPANRLGGKTGGRIAIAPDGSLFVTIGDRDDSPKQTEPDWFAAQKLDSDLGKVIHITADGAPAPGNPFIGKQGALPEIWSTGSRSPEGLAFDPGSGLLWETELGPRGGDEINIIRKGGNYGWPVIVHGIDYPGVPIGDGITEKEGMEQPVYYWDPSSDPAGMAFYRGNLFPQWRNSLFVAMMNGKFLDRLTISNNKIVSEEGLLADMNTRFRDVLVGPDGAVYVLTDSGTPSIGPDTPATSKLLKLTPK
jgi:glucose/arabinose dehydrogenase